MDAEIVRFTLYTTQFNVTEIKLENLSAYRHFKL